MGLESRLFKGLEAGKVFLHGMKDGRQIDHQGGAFGDATNGTELRADKRLGRFLRGEFMNLLPHTAVTVEGLEDVESRGHDWWVTIDPVDGSLNYFHADDMVGLPYTSCVTVLSHRDAATFGDILGAAVIDLRPGVTSGWMAKIGFGILYGQKMTAQGESRPLKTFQSATLDIGRMNVIGEFYYPENREKLVRAFDDKKGYLRSIGSAAYEMASVASGQAAAFICDRQKQHELGAGYALVKAAGGVAVDWSGNDLGPCSYDFKTQTPCILACNQMIADQILTLLNR